MQPVRFEVVPPATQQPTKAHEDDAAWDLYAAEDVTIYPGQIGFVM